MLKKLLLIANVAILSVTQLPVEAAVSRNNLEGGALGILQCWHEKGNKTKVVWGVIPTRTDTPQINWVDFTITSLDDGRQESLRYPVIPTKNYEDRVFFEGTLSKVNVFGSAYNISLGSVYTYRLKKSLEVKCDKLINK